MTATIHDQLLSRVAVLDSHMAYRSAGDDPDNPVALFLHGNPTSSFIWRNILPPVSGQARCIAPDLIGYGQSGKPDIDYSFEQIADYLDAFLDQLKIRSAYLVAQDWGTALAFHLAARRPGLVRGLAFMEFIRPMPTWQDFHQSDEARDVFRALRTPEVGEQLIYDQNLFIERILPGSVSRKLTEDEHDVYRAPFVAPSSRRPILRLARELPIEESPAETHALMTSAHEALRRSTYPKLLFVGSPGALVNSARAAEFAATLTNVEVVELPSGMHYVQEDHPEEIGSAVARWIRSVEQPGQNR